MYDQDALRTAPKYGDLSVSFNPQVPDVNDLTADITALVAEAECVTSSSGMAAAVTERDILTWRGGRWWPATVASLLRRLAGCEG